MFSIEPVVLFHGTSNECKITSVSAADSRNHSVDTYTVEQDKKKCSVSFTDTAVIDTAFTAEVSTDEPYIIELTVRDSQLPEYREIKDENVAMNTAQTAAKYNADDSVMKRVEAEPGLPPSPEIPDGHTAAKLSLAETSSPSRYGFCV